MHYIIKNVSTIEQFTLYSNTQQTAVKM